jgi:hypothetical protein
MRSKSIIVFAAILLTCSGVFSQSGGKAEPNRIQFAAGKSSITLTGTLSNSQEMEYVFAAKKGQIVTVKMSNTSLFDYRVFNPDADFELSLKAHLCQLSNCRKRATIFYLFARKWSKDRVAQNSV